MFLLLIFPVISDFEDYEDQYDDGNLDYLDSESIVSETEAETNEIAAGRNKRKSSTDLNTDPVDQSGKKPYKTKKKWLYRKRFLKFKSSSLIFFKSWKKDKWNLWKKC